MEGFIKTLINQLKQKQEKSAALEQQLLLCRGEEEAIIQSIDVIQQQLKINYINVSTLTTSSISEKPSTLTTEPAEKEKSTATSTTTSNNIQKTTRWADIVEQEEKETKDSHYEEDDRKGSKWYVIFNGPYRGVYHNWAIASQHINGKPVQHQSFKTKETADEAYRQSYKVMAMKEPVKNQEQQSQKLVMKIPSIKNILTTKEKEEQLKPIFQKFISNWDMIINYEEKHTTMGFYPVSRGGPKAVITEEASPELSFEFHQYGLIDTIYTTTMKVFEYFPQRMRNVIRRYLELFAKEREIFLKYTSSYPVFDQGKLLIGSKAVILMGVSNHDYPIRDDLRDYEKKPDYQVKGLLAVCRALTKIEPESQIKVNYSSPDAIITSKTRGNMTKEEWVIITDKIKEFTEINGNLSALPIQIKKQLCNELTIYEDHLCEWCASTDEDISGPADQD
ncbi:unnamed protein product [Linum trigynum]|uniref:Ribonuclease H1 N-terminal domain-containing protein n=1 Tax=Linum trigynum TaxID=586398 RepID=A0AAV2EV35_9ROSI